MFDGLLSSTALPMRHAVPDAVIAAPAIIHRGRWRTADELMTYDNHRPTHDTRGNHLGRQFERAYRSYDGQWYDSSGAFYNGELVRLDQTLHLPLASVSWGRDIDLRSDVTIADEATSWTLSNFGSPGGLGMSNAITGGKAWIGKNTTEIAGVSVDIAQLTKPLRPWAIELKYTVLELESALKIGRPIDQQKYQGMRLKHQMDIDAMVYAGDSDTGDKGLVNLPVAAPGVPGVGIITNFPMGAAGGPGAAVTGWMQGKTPADILADFNFALNTVWQQSGWAVVPSRTLLPTAQYGYIATQLVSTAGTTSILRYIEENNILARSGAGRLEIYPSKWCNGAGAGGVIGTPGAGATDRMVVYTKNSEYLRYPMTLLARTPIQFDAIWQKTSYYGRLGVLEVIYPSTMGYFDKL
jgi:hypothetical protein